MKEAGYVLGVEQEYLVGVYERTMLRKLLSVMDNASHPLHTTLESYWSIFSTTEHRKTFLPVAIKRYNSHPFSRK